MDTPTKSQKTMCRRSKACQNCHDRKVKCVVEAPGTTCNNCILDDVECFFARSNRGRYAALGASQRGCITDPELREQKAPASTVAKSACTERRRRSDLYQG